MLILNNVPVTILNNVPVTTPVSGPKYLYNQKPIRTGAMSTYPYSEELVHLFSFMTPYGEPATGVIRHEGGLTIQVPREAVPYADPPNDYRASRPTVAINCTFNPRPGQLELCQQSLGYLKEGRSHIFESDTGTGKTWMGSYIAAQMGQPTLIVCTKQDLMDQWLDALHGLKIDPSLIGRIQGGVCDYKGKMFVLGMIQSLMCLDKYEPAMYQYFGMMVLDEVHMMAADCFIRACQLFPAKLRLGLSATPKRKDGKTSLLHWHIGPTLVHGHIPVMKPKILMRQTGWKIPPMLPYAPGRMMTVYGAMAKSFPRNAEITNFVEAAYKADRRCLVMADTLPHLDALFQAITARGIAGNEIGYYVGGMKKQELDLTKKKKIILGTVKMCATGTDCPAWDSLCLATPHADVKQAVGRVLRALDGKKQPVILDLVDEDKLLRNFSNTRMKQYWAMEAEIVRL